MKRWDLRSRRGVRGKGFWQGAETWHPSSAHLSQVPPKPRACRTGSKDCVDGVEAYVGWEYSRVHDSRTGASVGPKEGARELWSFAVQTRAAIT